MSITFLKLMILLLLIFYWCVVALQCVVFCCTAKRISHMSAYRPCFGFPSHSGPRKHLAELPTLCRVLSLLPTLYTVPIVYTCQPQSSSTFSLAIVASLCRSGSRSEATISTDRERRCTTYQMHLWVPTCRHPRVLPHRNIDALTLPPAHSLGDFSQIHHIFMIVF